MTGLSCFEPWTYVHTVGPQVLSTVSFPIVFRCIFDDSLRFQHGKFPPVCMLLSPLFWNPSVAFHWGRASSPHNDMAINLNLIYPDLLHSQSAVPTVSLNSSFFSMMSSAASFQHCCSSAAPVSYQRQDDTLEASHRSCVPWLQPNGETNRTHVWKGTINQSINDQ